MRLPRGELLIGLAALLAALPAAADPAAENRAAAQVLFDQGKDLTKVGKFAEACPKFEESQRLDPRIATQFKLADCYEHVGKTASAWTNFVDVAASTKAAGQAEREQVARERADALEKRLSRLTIRVQTSASGLTVKRDGVVVGQPLWGVATPIDPGKHVIAASAPGRAAWESAVVVAEAATASVTVPEAAVEAAPAGPPPASPNVAWTPTESQGTSEGSSGGAQRVLGLTLGGVGLVGLGIGAAFGLAAKSKLDDRSPHCRTEQLCDADGLKLTEDARSAATISTIAFIAGGAALTGGVIVFLTAPSAERRTTGIQLAPSLAPAFAGGALSGAW